MSEERRVVTVLFADVTGSTELAEDLDPEQLRALLARYYDLAQHVVTPRGGVLEKFIGDAVMAVFGLERAYGDDAERAVAAAIGIRDAALADPELATLGLRFGIATGEVVASRDRSASDFLVTGDAVNIAARLQQAAKPWQLLVAERTARALGAFELGPEVEVAAKGKRQPVRARLVEAAARARRRARQPLIGREDELDQLRVAARRAFKERRPAVVTVVSPAGVGKTRLVEEFVTSALPSVAGDARVAATQFLPYGHQLTYQPLRQLLYALAGVADEADAAAARAAVIEWAPDAETGELLTRTALGADGEAVDRSVLFGAWRRAIEHAAEQPLVLVLEDLHWASDILLDLLEHVLQPRGEAAMVAIAMTRPELLERRPGWPHGCRNSITLFLEPLSRDETHELVARLLGPDAGASIEMVVARAAGNPFYAGELARALLETGDLTTLPDTVQAAVQARLDALPAPERRVLQLGSIFGRAFRPEDVVAVAPEVREAAGICEQLLERDLLRRGNGGRYAFRHILFREVAYAGLPRAERARLHAAAGAWIAAQSSGREDVQAEMIALHYREAAVLATGLRVASLDLDHVREEALAWLERAARAALNAGAHGEAAQHCRAALEIAEPRRQAAFWELLGRAETLQPTSVDDFRRALELSRAHGGPPAEELRILVGLLFSEFRWWITGTVTPDELRELRTRAAELADATPDERLRAAFFAADAFYAAYVEHLGGSPTAAEREESEEKARRGAEIAERIGAHNVWSAAMDALAAAAIARHDWETARSFGRVRLGAGTWLPLIERMDAYGVIGWMSILLGDLAEAAAVSEAGLAEIRGGRAGPPSLLIHTNLVHGRYLLGDLDGVFAGADEALTVWRSLGSPAGVGSRVFGVALSAARAAGDEERTRSYRNALAAVIASPMAIRMAAFVDEDLADLERELIDAPTLGVEFVTMAEHGLGQLVDRGQPPAPDVLAELLDFSRRLRVPILEAQARRALGVALGDSSLLAEAEAMWAGFGARILLAKARAERALLLGDGEGAAAALADVEALGDRTYVERMRDQLVTA